MQTKTSRSTSRRRWTRFIGTSVTAFVAATAGASAAGAASPSSALSGASGSVAAVSGSSMEVQNASTGQTTVDWTSSTQFSKTVTEAVNSLATGDCVTITGTPSKSSKTTISARSITVANPSSTGSCTSASGARGGGTSSGGAFGGPGGFRFRTGGSNDGGTRPSFPSGSTRRFPNLGSIAIASGKVTTVNGSTISVSGIDVSPGSFAQPTKNNKPSTPKTENLKITTSGSTTVSATQSTSPTALAVGDCVSAFGPAASNGAVTASTVRITSTGGASCAAGFGGGAFRGGGGFFGGGGAAGGASGGGVA